MRIRTLVTPTPDPSPQRGGENKRLLRPDAKHAHPPAPIRNSRAGMPSGPWVAATINPPWAR